jgi:Zn-dependent peptidase ImmA (M78 family)/transcriptional regulator with XRE-family HTH domain
MSQEILGQRLRQARELAGISQQVAADAIGAPRTALTQLEAGKRSVSTLELTKLAGIYHRPVMYFLEENPEEDDDIFVALHRAAPGLADTPEVKHCVNLCVDLCREGVALEHLLGRIDRSGPPTYTESVPSRPIEAVSQGERVAEQERRRLGIGSAPIADMADLIAGQGVWASGADLPNDMSGLFLRHRSIGLAILVHANHPPARKRFSYAHEYAHALLDRDRTVTVSSSDNAADLVEKRANAFAAAFLMPAEGVTDLLRSLDKGQPSRGARAIFDAATGGKIQTELRTAPGSQQITYQDAAMIAHHFGVSYQAAAYRLLSLRHISHKECESLLGQTETGKDYLRALDMFDELEKPEDEKLWTRELRSQVAHLALEAYRREEISRGKLLDISKAVSIPANIMLDLAEAARAA